MAESVIRPCSLGKVRETKGEPPWGLQGVFTSGLIILGDRGAEPWVRGAGGARRGCLETLWRCQGQSVYVMEGVGSFPPASAELSMCKEKEVT